MIENRKIHNSTCEKLLDVFFDNKSNFQSHRDNICKKAAHKLNAISRTTTYMDFNKRKLVVNAFFSSQFKYCPLIWMYHNRIYNNKINRLYERCLSLIYDDKCLTLQEVFQIKDQGDYFLRNQRDFVILTIKSVNYGLESIRFLGPKIWESLPNNLKNKESIESVKMATRLFYFKKHKAQNAKKLRNM